MVNFYGRIIYLFIQSSFSASTMCPLGYGSEQNRQKSFLSNINVHLLFPDLLVFSCDKLNVKKKKRSFLS